jgi:Domain of unknown function (DU1801)
MAEPKTRPTKQSVAAFLKTVTDAQKREDTETIISLMREVTKQDPVIWGTSIVGFGAYSQKYASGREINWPMIAVSPRKQNLTLYIMAGHADAKDLLAKLGKHSTGASCLYIKRLADIDMPTLKALIKQAFATMKKRHKPA